MSSDPLKIFHDPQTLKVIWNTEGNFACTVSRVCSLIYSINNLTLFLSYCIKLIIYFFRTGGKKKGAKKIKKSKEDLAKV